MSSRQPKLLFILGAVFFSAPFVISRAQQTEAGAGTQRFMEYCAGCHGADGRGGDKAPSLTNPPNAAKRSDTEVFRIVQDGTRGGMPPFAQIGDANIAAVLEYVRRLAESSPSTESPAEPGITGDAEVGRSLYLGKAQCSNCHLMRGKGGFIARNLTNYGRTRGATAILQAITDPDSPLVPSSQVVVVRTNAGQKLTGVLRNEDAFTVELQTEDGRFHSLPRNDVADVHYTGHSLMPRDYGKRLTSKELNDIVSFLVAESKRQSPNGSASQ